MTLTSFSQIWKSSFVWILFISYFRGFVSLFTGFLITQTSQSSALVFAFFPIIGVFLPKRLYQIQWIRSINAGIWIMTIFMPNIWIKIVLVVLGMGITLGSIVHERNKADLKFSGEVAIVIILGDYVIRSPNLGQDPIFYANEMMKLFLLIVLSVSIIAERQTATPGNLFQEESKVKDGGPYSFVGMLAMPLLLFIYMLDFSASGTLTLAFGINYRLAHFAHVILLISISMLFLSLRKREKDQTFSKKFFVAMLLGFSAFQFPFYGFAVIFWCLGILSLLYLMSGYLKISHFVDRSQAKATVGLVYALVVLLMFYGLLTESYLLIPLISILVGILSLFMWFVTKNLHQKIEYSMVSIPKLNWRKIFGLLLFIVFISSSVFIPVNNSTQEIIPTGIDVLTYNLHFGVGVDGKDNIRQTVDFILRNKPSIIAFQEVTLTSMTNGNGNMFGRLKELLEPAGYQGYLSEGGKFAVRNAVFSLFPIVEAQTYRISPRVVYERTFLDLTLNVFGTMIKVFAAHVTHVEELQTNPNRVEQIEDILKVIGQTLDTLPTILLGDFNAEPDWPEISSITNVLSDSWFLTNPLLEGFTWPSNGPKQRIDYIFHDESSLNALGCSLIDTQISDHLPLMCSFTII